MAKTVNIHEAKTHLSRLLEEMLAGEEIILARSGRPIARLVPFHEPEEREMGFAHYEIPDSFFDPLPEEELAAWENARNSF